MKKPGICIYLFLIFIFLLTSPGFSLMPRTCPTCWSKFNSLSGYQTLLYKNLVPGKLSFQLTAVKNALEKAKVGDRLSLELVLNNSKTLKLGTFQPTISRSGNTVIEKYNTMLQVNVGMPTGLKTVPASARLVIKDGTGQVKSSKMVTLQKQ